MSLEKKFLKDAVLYNFQTIPNQAGGYHVSNLADGKIDYHPKYVHAYQPIKSSMQRLLKIPNIVKSLEQWRNRQTVVNTGLEGVSHCSFLQAK